jgi:hypothetical protein
VISLLLHCSFIKTETAPGVAGGYDLQLQRGVNRVLALGAEPGSVAREGVFVQRGKKNSAAEGSTSSIHLPRKTFIPSPRKEAKDWRVNREKQTNHAILRALLGVFRG